MALRVRTIRARFDHHRGAAPLLRQTSWPRTIFFVLANLAGFIAISAFVQYLAVGKWLDFSYEGYRKSLVRSLSEIMISPLSIFAHPWMIVVWGVLAGALVIVPLLVGVLYRLRVAGLFILAVVVFAHAPLLAVALGAGSILAARTRLRSDLPFLAMLAGLAPVAAYLAVFSFGGDHILTPLQRTAILLPYALALAVALLGGGIVLALARVTKFRPGVIWPVLLVLVIAPVWLFYRKVGPGEFDYAVIADRVASGSGVLTATSAQDFRRWIPPATTAPASGPASAPAPVKARPVPPEELGELLKLCDQFLRRHGRHSRKAAVMWLRAAILEEQVRRRGPSGGTDSAGPAELHQAMIAAWDQLAARCGDSPQAMLAYERLGVEALRKGRFPVAQDYLRDAQALLKSYLGSARAIAPRTVWRRVFIPPGAFPGDNHYRAVRFEVDQIIWLMEVNHALTGDQRDQDAFQEYMKNWPFAAADKQELIALATGYEGTELAGNFRLRAALAERDGLARAMKLRHLADGTDDAAIIANYELGRLGMMLADDPAWEVMDLASAETYFRIVISAPENPYRPSAERYLLRLGGGDGG